MQSPILNLLLGPNNPAAANLMLLAQRAGLADLAMQAYGAYQSGKLPEFVAYQYEHNLAFRKFYDAHKDKTLREFLENHDINLV